MKARKLSLCPVLALLAVVGMTMGCARKTDDAKIASSIQSDFSADSGLQGKQVSVQSQNGVVTLSDRWITMRSGLRHPDTRQPYLG